MERRWDVEDGDRREGRWIFTREQLERVYAASTDSEKERRVRSATTEFIRKLGALLELHPSTVTAAVLLWRRYFAVRTAIVSDRVHLAVAALLLATKIDNYKRTLNDVLALGMPMYHHRTAKAPSQETSAAASAASSTASGDGFTESEVSEERRKVRVAEYELLEFTGFDMHVQQPYQTFVALAKGARVAGDVAERAWAVLCDVLATTDIPLRYTSAVVAAAVLHHALAAHAHAPGAAESTRALRELCWDLDPRRVDALCAEITALRPGDVPQQPAAAAASSAPETAQKKGQDAAPQPSATKRPRASRSPSTRSRSRSPTHSRSPSARRHSPYRYSRTPSRSPSSSRSPSTSRSRSRSRSRSQSRSRSRYHRREHSYSSDDYDSDRQGRSRRHRSEDRRYARDSYRRSRHDDYDYSDTPSPEYQSRGYHRSHSHHHRHHHRHHDDYDDDRSRRDDYRDRSRSRHRDTDYDRRR